MTADELIAANRTHTQFFVVKLEEHLGGGEFVVMIPEGWGDAFDDPDHGGPSFIDPDTEEASPELYGYGRVRHGKSPEYDTIYWKVAYLLEGREVTETEAKQADPGLFDYLDKINRGEE